MWAGCPWIMSGMNGNGGGSDVSERGIDFPLPQSLPPREGRLKILR